MMEKLLVRSAIIINKERTFCDGKKIQVGWRFCVHIRLLTDAFSLVLPLDIYFMVAPAFLSSGIRCSLSPSSDGQPCNAERAKARLEVVQVYGEPYTQARYYAIPRGFSMVIQPTSLLNPSFVLAASIWKLAESFQVLITSYPFSLA